MGKKITLNYSFDDHPTDPETIVISIKGSGIKASNIIHKKFMDILLNVVGTQMYAHANGIDYRDITITNKFPPKNEN